MATVTKQFKQNTWYKVSQNPEKLVFTVNATLDPKKTYISHVEFVGNLAFGDNLKWLGVKPTSFESGKTHVVRIFQSNSQAIYAQLLDTGITAIDFNNLSEKVTINEQTIASLSKINELQVVSDLPSEGRIGIVYLKEKSNGVYDQYIWNRDEDGQNGHWQSIGDTSVELSNYASTSQLSELRSSLDDYAKKTDLPDLDNYATKILTDTLATKAEISVIDAKIPSIDGLATKEELAAVESKIPASDSLVTVEVINSLATKAEVTAVENKIPSITNLATKAELSTVQGKIPSIANLATKAEVTAVENKIPSTSTFATKAELSNYMLKSDVTVGGDIDLSSLVTKSEYSSDKATFATKEEVSTVEAKIPSTDNLATKTEVSNKLDTSTYTTDKATFATKTDVANTYATKSELNAKQNTLTAGQNISIVGNVISATGGGGSGTSYSYISEDTSNHTLTLGTAETTGGVKMGTKLIKKYEKWVVVGVYGQSNAVGYDESALTKYDVPCEEGRVMQCTGSQIEPLYFCAKNLQDMNNEGKRAGSATDMGSVRTNSMTGDAFTPSHVDRTTKVASKGIHLPLANLICSVIPDDYGVIIVPAARGGRTLSTFTKGNADYNSFRDRLKYALGLHEDNMLAGIVWCQGEYDATQGTSATNYKNNFSQMITDLDNDIKTDNYKKLVNRTDPKQYWFVFEWPKYYKDQDRNNLLGAQKEVVGESHYAAIPDDTPSNDTDFTSATKQAHFGQDSYRKVIAPRVFAKMQAAGVFQLSAQAVTDSSSDSRIEELETQIGSMHDLITALQERVNELSEFHQLTPIAGSWKTVTTDMLTQVYGSGSVLGNGEISVGQNQTVLLPADVTRIRATPGDQVGSYRLLGMVLGAVPDADPATANNMIAAFTYFDGNAVQLAHLNDGTTIKLAATSGSDTYNPGTSGWGNKNNPITTLLGGNTSHNDFELEKLDKAKLLVTNRTTGNSVEMDMSEWPFFQNGGEIRFGFCGYNANNSGMKVTNLEYYS